MTNNIICFLAGAAIVFAVYGTQANFKYDKLINRIEALRDLIRTGRDLEKTLLKRTHDEIDRRQDAEALLKRVVGEAPVLSSGLWQDIRDFLQNLVVPQ